MSKTANSKIQLLDKLKLLENTGKIGKINKDIKFTSLEIKILQECYTEITFRSLGYIYKGFALIQYRRYEKLSESLYKFIILSKETKLNKNEPNKKDLQSSLPKIKTNKEISNIKTIKKEIEIDPDLMIYNSQYDNFNLSSAKFQMSNSNFAGMDFINSNKKSLINLDNDLNNLNLFVGNNGEKEKSSKKNDKNDNESSKHSKIKEEISTMKKINKENIMIDLKNNSNKMNLFFHNDEGNEEDVKNNKLNLNNGGSDHDQDFGNYLNLNLNDDDYNYNINNQSLYNNFFIDNDNANLNQGNINQQNHMLKSINDAESILKSNKEKENIPNNMTEKLLSTNNNKMSIKDNNDNDSNITPLKKLTNDNWNTTISKNITIKKHNPNDPNDPICIFPNKKSASKYLKKDMVLENQFISSMSKNQKTTNLTNQISTKQNIKSLSLFSNPSSIESFLNLYYKNVDKIQSKSELNKFIASLNEIKFNTLLLNSEFTLSNFYNFFSSSNSNTNLNMNINLNLNTNTNNYQSNNFLISTNNDLEIGKFLRDSSMNNGQNNNNMNQLSSANHNMINNNSCPFLLDNKSNYSDKLRNSSGNHSGMRSKFSIESIFDKSKNLIIKNEDNNVMVNGLLLEEIEEEKSSMGLNSGTNFNFKSDLSDVYPKDSDNNVKINYQEQESKNKIIEENEEINEDAMEENIIENKDGKNEKEIYGMQNQVICDIVYRKMKNQFEEGDKEVVIGKLSEETYKEYEEYLIDNYGDDRWAKEETKKGRVAMTFYCFLMTCQNMKIDVQPCNFFQ